MIYFIELWNPTEQWLALKVSEREDYLSKVAEATAGLIEQGVEVLTWTINEQETSYRGPYDHFAIWKFPNQEIADTFQKTVDGAGWYNYFDQVNVMGSEDSVQNGLNHLANLNRINKY